MNPPGWSVGQVLTSAQMNQLDSDHANSLDKSVAGDTLNGIVQIGNTGAIVTTQPGQINFNASASDWPLLSSGSRTINRGRGLSPRVALATSWTHEDSFLVAPATATPQFVKIDPLIHGATLQSIRFHFAVMTSHGSIASMVMPAFSVAQALIVPGTTQVPDFVFSYLNSSDSGSGLSVPNPGSGTTWYNSKQIQFFTYICNQNNLIDTTQYDYFIQIYDENGTGSIAGNLYVYAYLTYNVSFLQY